MRAGGCFILATMLLCGCIPRNAPERLMPRYAKSDVPLETDEGALVAPPPATWKFRDVRAAAVSVAASRYIVKPGDTLRGIGNRTGAGSEAIARENGLAAPYVIRPGQTLAIPGGRYHAVAAGETGIAIAQAYGADWGAIVADNALAPPYILRVGQRLRLPDGTRPRPDRDDPLLARARAFSIDIDDVVTGSQPALAEAAAPAAAAPASAAATATLASPAAFDGRFAWPMKGKIVGRYGTAGAGKRLDGIKLAAPLGTPVKASAPGTVVYAGSEIGVLGGVVLVDHGGGWLSAYGHLATLAVVRGQQVAAGAPIGEVGDSGYVTEPQLHFELRRDRKPVDPLAWLPKTS